MTATHPICWVAAVILAFYVGCARCGEDEHTPPHNGLVGSAVPAPSGVVTATWLVRGGLFGGLLNCPGAYSSDKMYTAGLPVRGATPGRRRKTPKTLGETEKAAALGHGSLKWSGGGFEPPTSAVRLQRSPN